MGIDKNLVQGSMALLLLRLLETKDMYGYEMIEALRHPVPTAPLSGEQGLCAVL